MWFWKIMVRFFISIDGILFNFISTLYDLLIAISRTSILTQGDIASFATRIEILLGIFMLFKISFSLITYIVNPDDFSDKSKGFGKLIQNTVVSLVLLVITPYIFQMAFSLQAKILDDNTLAKLLLGEKITSEDTGDDEYNGKVTILDTAGNSMAFYVMLPFFTPRTSIDGLESCTVLYSGGKFNDECADAMKDLAGTSNSGENSDDENTVTSDEQYVDNYKYGIENESLGLTFRSTAALLTTGEGDSEQFLIDYKYILSTATAVIVCLLLITFCIDVGVRSVKLAFLQLIYPIPVISYMDPKSGNDGMFTKWYKMCLSTFLSLFIRLLALYFGIYIISKVGTMGMYDIINGSQITNGWVKIFVIIGILMFVKQMPKILENLGIKIDGDGKFNLNPLKKLEEGALGGKVLKKPNEMLGKAGKGLMFAAPHALQTGGKKVIGGIDAARNGKGFKQGWNRTHGKLYNAYHKKLDEWAPDSAEARKNERLGREEVAQMKNKWTEGKKAADKLYDYAAANGGNPNKPFDMLNGSNKDAYKQVYKSGEFINSRMNLDKMDAKNKILQRISEQTMRGSTVNQAIAAEQNAIDELDAIDSNLANSIRNLADTDNAKATAKFTEELDKTSKTVAGMEKVHESIRKQNASDAATEDALKHVKYNTVDPTTPSRSAKTGNTWNR